MYKLPKEKHIERLVLWGRGLTDEEIAQELALRDTAIRSWRVKFGLKANKKTEEFPANIKEAVKMAIQECEEVSLPHVIKALRQIIPHEAVDNLSTEVIREGIKEMGL